MVKRREKSKREMINLTLDIVEKRFHLEDFRDELFSLICNEAKPSFRFSKVSNSFSKIFFSSFSQRFPRFSKKLFQCQSTIRNRLLRLRSEKRRRRWRKKTKVWSVENGCFRMRKNGIDRRLRFCHPRKRQRPRLKAFR